MCNIHSDLPSILYIIPISLIISYLILIIINLTYYIFNYLKRFTDKIKLYETKSDAEADKDEFAVYEVMAEYDADGKMSSYLVTKQ